MFTIEDARRVQQDLNLTDRHIVWYDPAEGFAMAHTDAERASGMNLTDCLIHKWLSGSSMGFIECCFPRAGWYQVWSLHEAIGLAL